MIERRYYASKIRIEGQDSPKIVGLGAVFNSLSEDLGGFLEMVMPGAFAETILKDDVRALINHDSNLILGRNRAGTLRLSENEAGLVYEIDPPATSYANDLQESLRRGDVDQSSFGFNVLEESWRNPDKENPLPVRILHRVKLYDVSPVTFPAYQATSVSLRAIDQAKHLSKGGQVAGADSEPAASHNAGRVAVLRAKLNLLKIR